MTEEVEVKVGKIRAVVVGTAVVGGLLLTAGPVPAGSVRVKATDSDSFSPATKKVARGTKVVWKNPSGSEHNVTAYSSNWSKSSTIDEGQRTKQVFRKRGTYKYRCTLHSDMDGRKCDGMCGKIVVK